jgi:hypothetical protein
MFIGGLLYEALILIFFFLSTTLSSSILTLHLPHVDFEIPIRGRYVFEAKDVK